LSFGSQYPRVIVVLDLSEADVMSSREFDGARL
jgi:hypothetical protein